ncbi:hypothetical protein BDY21DRAFT_334655 [Lineolata rhizophorae]|uniref:Uncharacterized protein n=1 Tax=Lineolata rhizophorae TaxID=578093 RepID=A0A6A6PBC0_9PEZI|nr:hypothetical protein BDY21DRAFT_334655 [Lineolata rhizophorae]
MERSTRWARDRRSVCKCYRSMRLGYAIWCQGATAGRASCPGEWVSIVPKLRGEVVSPMARPGTYGGQRTTTHGSRERLLRAGTDRPHLAAEVQRLPSAHHMKRTTSLKANHHFSSYRHAAAGHQVCLSKSVSVHLSSH